MEITVKAVTALKIRQECNQDSSGVIRALPGERVFFNVYPMAGGEVLLGFFPGILDSVPGLSRTYSEYSTSVDWRAPDTAVQIPLKSRVLAKSPGSLRTLAIWRSPMCVS